MSGLKKRADVDSLCWKSRLELRWSRGEENVKCLYKVSLIKHSDEYLEISSNLYLTALVARREGFGFKIVDL